MQKGMLLSRMLLISTTAHEGQYDKGGQPYILHPLKVMYYLKSEDEELQCIARGHDLFEDTNIDRNYLEKDGFSERVICGIECLTKRKNEPMAEYKKRVFANPDAIRVKMADLRHNSDIRRLKGITEKDFDRMQKYHEFYLELKDRL